MMGQPRFRFTDLPCIASQVIAAAVVCVTPWLVGGVQAEVQTWLALAVASALVLAGVYLFFGSGPRGVGVPAMIPLLVGLGFVTLQLLPLEPARLRWWSPKGAELRDTMESGTTSSDAAMAQQLGIPPKPQSSPISLYPASTRQELALIVVAVAMFAIGAVCFRDPAIQYRFCVAVAVNGALLVFVGLIQRLAWNGYLLWFIPLTEGGEPFGPFVNRNNAGGFLNLCLGGAVGWAVCAFASDPVADGDKDTERRTKSDLGWIAQAKTGFRRFLLRLDVRKLASSVIIALLGAGVLCTLSRGAVVAMLGAALLVFALVSTRKQWRFRALVAVFLATAGLALVGWLGMWRPVMSHLATLLDGTILTHGLINLWRDSLHAVGDFWATGTGLGTFRYVYGLYQQQPASVWYYYAENHYVQTLIEAGIPGLSLICLMIALVGWAGWRVMRRDPDPRGAAFAVAVIFAWGAQAIHVGL